MHLSCISMWSSDHGKRYGKKVIFENFHQKGGLLSLTDIIITIGLNHARSFTGSLWQR